MITRSLFARIGALALCLAVAGCGLSQRQSLADIFREVIELNRADYAGFRRVPGGLLSEIDMAGDFQPLDPREWSAMNLRDACESFRPPRIDGALAGNLRLLRTQRVEASPPRAACVVRLVEDPDGGVFMRFDPDPQGDGFIRRRYDIEAEMGFYDIGLTPLELMRKGVRARSSFDHHTASSGRWTPDGPGWRLTTSRINSDGDRVERRYQAHESVTLRGLDGATERAHFITVDLSVAGDPRDSLDRWLIFLERANVILAGETLSKGRVAEKPSADVIMLTGEWEGPDTRFVGIVYSDGSTARFSEDAFRPLTRFMRDYRHRG